MTHLRRAREEAQEQTQPVSEYWLPQPFEYADPKAGRAFVDPVYDPFTKTVRPWGDFFWPKKDLDERHKLKRPDWEHPGDWYDEGYVEKLEALLLKEPPRAYVRNPEEIDLRPIKKLKKYAPKGRKGLDNILSVLEKAEPEEIDYWRHWYGYAHLEAVKLSERHNRPVDLCAGVIAVLSPKELWETNLYLADRALAMDWDEVKAMDTNRAKAYSLVVENDFSVIGGGKVFDFFLSVADPVAFQERVVVDTHAINIWRGIREGEAPQISKKERQRLAADYAEAGRISSLSPQAIQAITWVLWRQYPSEKGTAPIETEELPETWGKGQFEDFYQPGEEEHPDIAEYYGLGDLPEGEFVEPIEPTEHWYGKYGQLAEPIRDVVGYRCPHCKESIHEKFGSSWDEESDAHVCNKCGGKFHYKTEEERATEREALERLFPSMRMARAAGVTVEPKRPSINTYDLELESSGGYENIMKVLGQATPEELDYWANWYSHASEDVQALAARYGLDPVTTAGVVAVLSPGNKWFMNLRAAEAIISGEVTEAEDTYVENQVGDGELGEPGVEDPQTDLFGLTPSEEQTAPTIAPGINAYPANIAKAQQILRTGDTSHVTGPKVTKFFESLVKPEAHADELVLDGHAINLWRGEKRPLKGIRQPNKAEREQMLADYDRAAADFGIPVQGVQAVTWYIWKHVVTSPQMSLFAQAGPQDWGIFNEPYEDENGVWWAEIQKDDESDVFADDEEAARANFATVEIFYPAEPYGVFARDPKTPEAQAEARSFEQAFELPAGALGGGGGAAPAAPAVAPEKAQAYQQGYENPAGPRGQEVYPSNTELANAYDAGKYDASQGYEPSPHTARVAQVTDEEFEPYYDQHAHHDVVQEIEVEVNDGQGGWMPGVLEAGMIIEPMDTDLFEVYGDNLSVSDYPGEYDWRMPAGDWMNAMITGAINNPRAQPQQRPQGSEEKTEAYQRGYASPAGARGQEVYPNDKTLADAYDAGRYDASQGAPPSPHTARRKRGQYTEEDCYLIEEPLDAESVRGGEVPLGAGTKICIVGEDDEYVYFASSLGAPAEFKWTHDMLELLHEAGSLSGYDPEFDMQGRRRAWEDKLPGGKADDLEPGDFDCVELLKGVADELEHTDDPATAAEVAMDHLVDDPDYYAKHAQAKPYAIPKDREPYIIWDEETDPEQFGEGVFEPDWIEDERLLEAEGYGDLDEDDDPTEWDIPPHYRAHVGEDQQTGDWYYILEVYDENTDHIIDSGGPFLSERGATEAAEDALHDHKKQILAGGKPPQSGPGAHPLQQLMPQTGVKFAWSARISWRGRPDAQTVAQGLMTAGAVPAVGGDELTVTSAMPQPVHLPSAQILIADGYWSSSDPDVLDEDIMGADVETMIRTSLDDALAFVAAGTGFADVPVVQTTRMQRVAQQVLVGPGVAAGELAGFEGSFDMPEPPMDPTAPSVGQNLGQLMHAIAEHSEQIANLYDFVQASTQSQNSALEKLWELMRKYPDAEELHDALRSMPGAQQRQMAAEVVAFTRRDAQLKKLLAPALMSMGLGMGMASPAYGQETPPIPGAEQAPQIQQVQQAPTPKPQQHVHMSERPSERPAVEKPVFYPQKYQTGKLKRYYEYGWRMGGSRSSPNMAEYLRTVRRYDSGDPRQEAMGDGASVRSQYDGGRQELRAPSARGEVFQVKGQLEQAQGVGLFTIQVVRQHPDGTTEHVYTNGDADLDDVAMAASAYSIGAPDFDAAGGVTARGPGGLEMRVMNVSGLPLDEQTRTDALYAMARTALKTKAMCRRLAVLFPKMAVSFSEGATPGQMLVTTQDLQPSYGFPAVPAGTEFVFEGWHSRETDDSFKLPDLGLPVPDGTSFDNLRLRLMPQDEEAFGGSMLIVTPAELDQAFEVQEEVEIGDVGELMEMRPYEEPQAEGGYADLPGGEGVSVERGPVELPSMGQELEPVMPRSWGPEDLPPGEYAEEIAQLPTTIRPSSVQMLQPVSPQAPPSSGTKVDRPRTGRRAYGGRMYQASLVFEVGNGTDVEWIGRGDLGELQRVAALYDVKATSVERAGSGWLAFHGRPVLGPHGSGRFVLRVEAAVDGAKVAAALGEGR